MKRQQTSQRRGDRRYWTERVLTDKLGFADKKQMRITHVGSKVDESVANRWKKKKFNVKKIQLKTTVKMKKSNK